MQRIFLTAIIAGCVAGIFAFGLQAAKLAPLILHAEVYEEADNARKEAVEATMAKAHEGHAHEHEENEWEPANGFERNGYRVIADIGVGVGFGLMLVGAFALRGDKLDAHRGLLWGLAGFAVFSLAPAAGLPPELPGTMSADLDGRQVWWLATAVATAVAIALMAFTRGNVWKVAALVILAAPHIVGAPHPETIGGPVPTELNAQFAAASLAISAAFWMVLGAVSGWLYGRQNSANPA